MSAQDFSFALHCFGEDAPEALVGHIAAHVFHHVGCACESLPELSKVLHEAAASSPGAECRYDVRCSAARGRLEVVVSANGARIWQASSDLA